MPGGWVSTQWASDLHPADVQEAIVGVLVAAGWTVKRTYRASYWFSQLFHTAAPPPVGIPDSGKSPAPCSTLPHDFTSTIDGVTYMGYDPYRQTPPGGTCKGFQLGESEIISAENFAAVASGSPYFIKVDGSSPLGFGVGFTAVAKEPGARGDAREVEFPFGGYDTRMGEDAYPGYLMESPADVAGKTFQIHLWDGNTVPATTQANYFHCFRVYDSYGGQSDVFSLALIFRARDVIGTPIIPDASASYYKYEIIATEDSLLVIPFQRTDLDRFTGEIVHISNDIYGEGATNTMGCLYISRPVVTQEAIDSGVEASLLCHLPFTSYGYDEMNTLWYWAQLQGLNEPLELNNSRASWSTASLVFPTFRSAPDEPKLLTGRGDILRSSVFAMAAQSDAEEAGLVGALNSVICVADPTYTDICQARMQTADGTWWKLIFQNQLHNHWGFYYNFSLWHAESDTPKGQFYDPSDTNTKTDRPLSSVLNPSHDWVLHPESESGNDAILFAGGEGLVTIMVLHDDSGWPIQMGSYPRGDPGTIYWDSTAAIPDTLGKFVRVWGFPDCARIGHSYAYTFRATDTAGHHIDQDLTVTVTEGSFVSMEPLLHDLSATKCVMANLPFTTGCPGGSMSGIARTWTLTGTIPVGMTFTPTSGAAITAHLSGTPTGPGYYEFSVAANDSSSGDLVAWAKYKLTVADNPGVSC